MTDSGPPESMLARAARSLRPSHEHSAFSATLLLMAAVLLSRMIGYVREAYIAWAFGAGPQTDAYVAAFTIPDWLNYMLAGGTASVTFIPIFTRFLAQKREQDAQRAFSAILTFVAIALTAGILLAEIFTPQLTRLIFPRFTPEQVELCARLTRILLPAQLFFYVGGIVAAVLSARRMFLLPALGPLLYNVCIILGGVLLGGTMGVGGLAVGALAGSFAGPFLVNAIGAGRAGMSYRPSLDLKNESLREWVRLSIPLMVGVSLVTADEWILRFFASGGAGDITRLNYAKRLLAVPIGVLAQATAQASLPFFARLFGENRRREFAEQVSGSVYRVVAASMLAVAWMMVLAVPLVDLVYRRGRFAMADTQQTAAFFFIFAIALPLWAAQGLYSRAFYAAGNTLAPMVAGTLVTLASLPLYAGLFHRFDVLGLAWASNLGILVHTVVLAALLHRRSLVRLGAMPWGELRKALVVTVFAFAMGHAVARAVPLDGSQLRNLEQVLLVSLTWAAAVAGGLWLTGSGLLTDLRKKSSAVSPQPSVTAENGELQKP